MTTTTPFHDSPERWREEFIASDVAVRCQMVRAALMASYSFTSTHLKQRDARFREAVAGWIEDDDFAQLFDNALRAIVESEWPCPNPDSDARRIHSHQPFRYEVRDLGERNKQRLRGAYQALFNLAAFREDYYGAASPPQPPLGYY